MDELIIRVLSGDASPAEEEEVQCWRTESSENEASFQSARHVWALTEALPRTEVPEPPGGEFVAGAWERQRDEETDPSVVSLAEKRRAAGRPSNALRWTVALAAGVAAVAIGLQAVGWPAAGPLPVAVFAADAEDVSTVTLDDGSRVRLAPGSRLEQWEAEAERRFSLTGRAFFAVAHDPTRPFVVEAGDTEARVLGTRFELLLSDGDLRTVVVDGRVAVSNEEGRVEIPAGGVGHARRGEPPTTELPEDLYALLDWPGGMLIFQATPLARVAEEVGLHFGLTVDVHTDQLRAFRISASFDEESFQEIIRSLCDVVAAAGCSVTDTGASIGTMH